MILKSVQEPQTHRQIATEACGFIAIIIGTFLLHATKDLDITLQNLRNLTTPSLAAIPADEIPVSRPQNSEMQRRVTATPSRSLEEATQWI